MGVRDTDFVFFHSHRIFLDTTVFKANSCEKFEAKINEKRASEYLKRTSESHVKRISVRLLFALKRKKTLSETGAPYSCHAWQGGKVIQGSAL
jgi:hypothetical protein